MDPGLSTQLLDLYHPVCDAGWLTYITFIVQTVASFYGIVTVSIIWAQNAHLRQEPYGIQLQQQLAALTINRGMWSIAALGAFYPWAPLHAIYLTTIIAVVLEFLFAARGFLIGWQMYMIPGILNFFVVFAWLLPSAEALTLILGTPSHLSFVASTFIPICHRPHRDDDGSFVHLSQGDHIWAPSPVATHWALAHHWGVAGVALWHGGLSCR